MTTEFMGHSLPWRYPLQVKLHKFSDTPSGACSATNGPLTSVTTTDAYDGKMMTAETTVLGSPVGFNRTVNWVYDTSFRVSEMYIDSKNWTDTIFHYDNDSLLSTVGSVPSLTVNGQNYAVIRGSGGGGLVKCITVGSLCEKYTYNAFGELIEQKTINSWCDATCSQTGSATLLDINYDRTVDPAGRITTKTEEVDGAGTCTSTYGYDPTYVAWLNSASRTGTGSTSCTGPSLTQTYDLDGNIVSGLSSGTYDVQDRLNYDGSWTYSYDANGNRAWERDPFNDYFYTMFDAVGNLRRYQPNFNPIDYIIDRNNRRVGRLKNGVFKEGYIYDRERIIGHVNNVGTLDAYYVYVTKPNVPDLIVTSATTYRVISDQIGSVRRIFDLSNNTSVLDMAFDAFGLNQTWLNGASKIEPTGIYIFGFAGGLWDFDTSLYHFGARDYDPSKGTWISKDPIRFDGGLNLYAYCHNDPVNCIDPLGQAPADFEACIESGQSFFACWFLLFTPPFSSNNNRYTPYEPPPWDDFGTCPPGDPQKPKKQDDCEAHCLPYLGSGDDPFPVTRAQRTNGEPYLDANGKLWFNDTGGAWAYQRCMYECMSKP